MVMTEDRRGIRCDFCGEEYRDEFDYYSLRIDKVVVNSKIQKTGVVSVDRRMLDFDICEKCYQEMIDRARVVIDKEKLEDRSKKWEIKGG